MNAGQWIFAGVCSLFLLQEARADALYWIGAEEEQDTSGLKWISGIDVAYHIPVVGSLASAWVDSDPDAARDYLSYVSSSEERNLPAWVTQHWLSEYQVSELPDRGSERDRMRWQIASYERDRDLARRNRDGGVINTWEPLQPGDTGAVVPEPSAALLGGLGVLGLLFRRRQP